MLLTLFLLSLQVTFAGVGLWWMLAKRLHYAGYEIPSPHNFFMGAVLFFQLPLYFFVGQSAGAAEVIRSVMGGNTYIDTKKIQQKWGWLHPTITGSSAAIAGLIGACTLRREKVTATRHESPIGVRDYVRDRQKIEEAEPRGRRRLVANFDDDDPER